MYKIKLSYLALIISAFTLVVYHVAFYKFVCNNIDVASWNGMFLLFSLTIFALLFNAFFFYVGLYLLRVVAKWILVLFFNLNAIAVYFIKTYGIIVDKSMMGNVFNTNFAESSSYFSFTIILYILFMGVLPSILLFKVEVVPDKLKRFFINIGATLVFLASFAYVNSSNWLWIDKHSKTLGALVMPWSYVVNSCRFFSDKHKENKEQIKLPDATITDNEKAVMVLVIGESARSENFSLYGYQKNTNPLLSQMSDVHHYKTESCATYTTAGVKCILSHKHSGKLYEILPNYLFRNNVDVIWRTTNWGEPTVKIDTYQKSQDLQQICEGKHCEYDDLLLVDLKEQIQKSTKNKILVVLHTSTSHGPTYYKKYPTEFEVFNPVCKSVELAECSQEELINAYNNTIVYTDYLLSTLISKLKELQGYKTAMLFVSDHGESLGENNLYMHGLPVGIAPKQQLDIPFIVWSSANSKQPRNAEELSQHNVFHSVLDFLSVDSPIYEQEMSVFE